MVVSFKELELINSCMQKLQKGYGFFSSLCFNSLEDLFFCVEFSYRDYDMFKDYTFLFILPKLERYILNYYFELPGDFPSDDDLCRLVIKLKF